MKVLWITNALLPEANSFLTKNNVESRSTGSWIVAFAESLRNNTAIELNITAVSPLVKKLTSFCVNKITYHVIPKKCHLMSYSKKYEAYMKEIHDDVHPDIVHIHGTERPLGLAYVIACGNENVVASIQGMPSVISDYYLAGLSKLECLKYISFHDIIKRYDPISVRSRMRKCGEYEKLLISKINNVIGRTKWDKAHCYALNPYINYYYCGEPLRDPFYCGIWKYDLCKKNTIFVSQAGYPLKGFHILLRALPIVRRQISDIRVIVAGTNITKLNSLKDHLLIHTYGKYIRSQIEKMQLEDIISFIGPLNAQQMAEHLKSSNLYVNCSSIENSPNSLGEAQMIGVPCISSYVGGTMDMIPDGNCGTLYRFEDSELLAFSIIESLQQSATFNNEHVRTVARERHNKELINAQLINVYEQVAKETNSLREHYQFT